MIFWQVFILEFISTLILGLVTFATVVDRERNMADNAAPLAVGLAYTIGMFAEGPYTGGETNGCGSKNKRLHQRDPNQNHGTL